MFQRKKRHFIRDFFHDRKRRHQGTFEIRDLRPSVAENPYTFFVPRPEAIAAIKPGMTVKLIFASLPPSYYTGAERMWVTVTKTDGEKFEGRLDNIPLDIPQMSLGQTLQFEAHNIASVIWNDEEEQERLDNTDREEEMFKRCLVDDCVLHENVPIGFLNREEPETFEGQKYSDSGWRIRGLRGSATDEEYDGRKASFVAIGAVLNRDDSILDLLSEPIGCAYEREDENAPYQPAQSVGAPED